MRRQVEDRILFSREQKEKILEKSSCKCARCGQALTVESMTVEHIVPLSKGGTNDSKNLVSLCYDCNQMKGNYILHPLDYYPYINKEYINELKELFQSYLTEVPWYGRRNYTKEDKKLFYYISDKIGQIKKVKNGKYLVNCFRNNVTFERVYNDEFDEIYQFVKDYNDKYNISSDGLKSYLSEVFDKGCIYKLYTKTSIIAILPFTVEALDIDGKMRYKLRLNGIPNKYQKHEYLTVIADAIKYVMECLAELNYLNATNCVVSVPDSDNYVYAIAKKLRGECVATTENWQYFLLKFISSQSSDKTANDFLYQQSSSNDFDKIDKVISDGLERRLHLPSLHKKQELEESNKTNKEKLLNNKSKKKVKHKKRDYDEYDIEYYK